MLDIKVPADQESPMKQAFNKFDIEHTDWTSTDYQKYAGTVDIKYTTDLLVKEIAWRRDHCQNFVASIEGEQGSGKSTFFLYLSLLIGEIYGMPFSVENVHYAPEELDKAIQKAKKRETHFRDEHRRTVGQMSKMIDQNLADYEDQLRKDQINLLFASVALQDHSHTFCFEAKNIFFNKDGYPTHVKAMFKTRRYTSYNEFVWRGFVVFPVPDRKFMEAYNQRKDKHLVNLKKKYGNTLDPIPFYAKQILKKKEKDIIRKTKEGYIIPIKSELMDIAIANEIGTMRFTTYGNNVLKAELREMIIQRYAKINEEIARAIEQKQEKEREEKKKEREEQSELAEKRRLRKLEIQRQKVEEEKRKNDLKQRALDLKAKELETRKKKKKKNKGVVS